MVDYEWSKKILFYVFLNMRTNEPVYFFFFKWPRKIKGTSSYRVFGEPCYTGWVLSPSPALWVSTLRSSQVTLKQEREEESEWNSSEYESTSGFEPREIWKPRATFAWWALFLPSLQVFALFQIQCFMSKYTLSTLIVLHPQLFVPLVLSWEAKEAGKAFRLSLCPFLSSLPFQVSVRAEGSPRSILVSPLLLSRPFMLPQVITVGACCDYPHTGHHFVCAHALTYTCALPRIFVGTLLDVVRHCINLLRQSANCPLLCVRHYSRCWGTWETRQKRSLSSWSRYSTGKTDSKQIHIYCNVE